MSITIVILLITVAVSIIAFKKQQVMDDLIFYPPAVTEKKQYYRFITCGLIHADFFHLLFNMVSFYSFSSGLVEPAFKAYFGTYGATLLLIMYVLALIVSLLPTYIKNKMNTQYRSLGASGAVSAVIFAGIMILPLAKMGIFIIPPIIPGFIFGPLFLVISAYFDKRGGDNINHSAHIFGALFGVLFIIVATKLFTTVDIWGQFIDQVKGYLYTMLNIN